MINVSGNLKDLSGAAITTNAYVRFYLRGAADNQPYVSGVALIPPVGSSIWYKDFQADPVTGAVSGQLYATSEITVGGVTGAIWYGMVVVRGGITGPESSVVATGDISVNNPTLLSVSPVPVAPTGDTTYLKLDGSNSPVTGSVAFSGSIAFNSTVDAKILNGVPQAHKYAGADMAAKLIAAIADAVSLGVGLVNAKGITGNQTGNQSVTVPVGVRLELGLVTYVPSVSPAFLLNGHGSELIGLSTGDTTQTSSGRTVIRPTVATTSDVIQVTPGVSGIIRSARLQGLKIDMSNATAARHGVNIGAVHESHFEDVYVFNAPSEGWHIEPNANASYRNTFVRCHSTNALSHGLHLTPTNASGEIRYQTFINCQFDNSANPPATSGHGIFLDVPAGSVASFQQIGDIAFINCAVSQVQSGKHGVYLSQQGSGTIFGVSYKGLIETTATGTGTAFRIDSAAAANVQGVHVQAEVSGFTTGQNVTTANALSFYVWLNGGGAVTDSLRPGSDGGKLGDNNLRWVIDATAIGPTDAHRHTIPDVAVDTFALLAASQTLTNKTLATPLNGLTTAGQTVPVILGATSQKAESAADANVLTVTPAASAGSYRLRFVLSVSAANAATLGWTATWKDSNGTAQSPTNLSLLQEGTAAPALTFTTSVAGNYYAEALIDIDNSATNIVIKLTFAGTSFTAKASATLERII
jgi:hypothetical protein